MASLTGSSPLDLTALIGWFEDIGAGRARSRAVSLASNDAPARLATLQSLYLRLVEHRSFGGAWPWSLPPGSLAPAISLSALPGIPPRMAWFGLCCTPEPAAEAAQLCAQLEQLARFPDIDPWVRAAAERSFGASLGEPAAGGADRLARAFGFLERNGDADRAWSATMRDLDAAVLGPRLLADGGILGHDAARSPVRALVAAGWIERLARTTPVVLAIDEAHLAGSFVVTLVSTLAMSNEAVLVVLAGEPELDAPPGGASLAGPLGGISVPMLHPFSLPTGDAGYLAAALASITPTGLFTDHHVALAAQRLGVGDEAALLADELARTGWLRPLTAGVHAFGSAARHRAARRQSAELVGTDLGPALGSLCQEATARSADDPLLATLVALHAQADTDGPASGATWARAELLARLGEVDRAAASGAAATSAPHHRALVDAWRSDDGLDRHPEDATTIGDDAECRLVLAGSLAHRDHEATRQHLAAALAAVLAPPDPPDPPDPPVDGARPRDADPVRHRVAAARIALAVGDLTALANALGEDAPRWLSPEVLERLVELHVWHDRPGLVARVVETARRTRLVDVLRASVPDSVALGHALLSLLEHLEAIDGLRAATGASDLSAEAIAIFGRRRQSPPTELWRARTWHAVCELRSGDPRLAVNLLVELADEQARALHPDAPPVLATRRWLGRALLDTNRVDQATAILGDVVRVQDGVDPLDVLAARHWRAAAELALGHHGEAAGELAEVVARRAALLPDADDDLLDSRQLLGSALARSGQPTEALAHLDEVLRHRAGTHAPDAARILAARHARGVCSLLLQRYPEALADLDHVVTARAAVLPATDDRLVTARTDRARALLMQQRFAEAVADLDPALAVLSVRSAPDDQRLLLARQQRAVCLRALGRDADAAAELDGIIAATAMWPRNHPFVATMVRQRAELTDELAHEASIAPATAP